MKLCDKCFSSIEGDAAFCPECGARLSDDPEGSDAIIYPEIARANLLRMRGDMMIAEKICLNLLKRFQNNSTVHILLGDIHLEQGQYDQAKQWYEMALDLAPDNPGLKLKLSQVQSYMEKEASTRARSGLEISAPGKAMVAMYVSFGLLALLVAGAAFWLGNTRGEAVRDRRAVIDEPISIEGVAPELPPTHQQPQDSPPAPGPVTAGAMTVEEQSLRQAAAAELGELGPRLVGVTRSARTGVAVATVTGAPGRIDYVDAAVVAYSMLRHADVPRVEVRVVDPATQQARFSGSMTAESLAAGIGEFGSEQWAASVLFDVGR